MKEAEISIFSMFVYLFRKWKTIIICMMLGALLLVIVGNATLLSDEAPEQQEERTQSVTLLYMVETEKPDVLSGIYTTYILTLRSSKEMEGISRIIGVSETDASKYVYVESSGINEVSTMACFSINISKVSELKAKIITDAVMSEVDMITEELVGEGYLHDIKLINCDNYVISDKEELIPSVTTSVEPNYHENRFIVSKKKVVLGMAAGFLLAVVFYSIIFIFSGKLDVDDDIQSLYSVYYVGKIPGPEYGKLLYKLRNIGKRTFDYDESIKLVVSQIKMVLSTDNSIRLGMVGCGVKKHSDKVYNDIYNMLKNEGLEIELIDDVLYNSESVRKLSDISSVFLLEKAGETYRYEIRNEMEMMKKLGKKVEGLIISE